MSSSNVERAAALTVAAGVARQAGAAVRDLYDRAAAGTYAKVDGSPVTDADLAADRIIRDRIGAAFPDDALLTEEGADEAARLSARRCWIVDPIDGTQQFIDRTGEFDVLIALVEAGRPIVAASYQPSADVLLTASVGGGAWIERGDDRLPLRFRPVADGAPARLLTSSWLGGPENGGIVRAAAARIGATVLPVSRFGVLPRHFAPPDHAADVLIGLNQRPAMVMAWEWDFAAADLIVHEAGGRFSDLRGALHRYNKPAPRNTGGLLLSVDPATHDRVVEALSTVLP